MAHTHTGQGKEKEKLAGQGAPPAEPAARPGGHGVAAHGNARQGPRGRAELVRGDSAGTGAVAGPERGVRGGCGLWG